MNMQTEATNKEQIEFTNMILNEKNKNHNAWLKEAKIENQLVQGASDHTAAGTVEITSFIYGHITMKLDFGSGEKFTFKGKVVGELLASISSGGLYIGAKPKAGDEWSFEVDTRSFIAGGLTIPFYTVKEGARGVFTGGSIGNASGLINYGSGVWSKGY